MSSRLQNRLRSSLFLLPVIFCIRLPAQSCIVVNVTPNEIMLGADSKANFIRLQTDSSKVSLQQSSIVKSKIREENRHYYVLASEAFSIDSIIKSAAVQNNSFDMFVHVSRYKIQEHLNVVLEEARRRDTGFIGRNFPGLQITQVVFFGFEKDAPRVIVVWFGVSPMMEYPVEVSSGFREIVNNHAAIGVHDSFDDQFDNLDIWSHGPAAAIRYFITKQIQVNPDALGNPIILLQLTKKGKEWNPSSTSSGGSQ